MNSSKRIRGLVRQTRHWGKVLDLLVARIQDMRPTVMREVSDEARRACMVLREINMIFRAFELRSAYPVSDEALCVRGGWLKGAIGWRPAGPGSVTIPPEFSINFRAAPLMDIARDQDVPARAAVFFFRSVQLAGYLAGHDPDDGPALLQKNERIGPLLVSLIMEGFIGGLGSDLIRIREVLQRQLDELSRSRALARSRARARGYRQDGGRHRRSRREPDAMRDG